MYVHTTNHSYNYHVSKTTCTFTCGSVYYSMIGRTVCRSQLKVIEIMLELIYYTLLYIHM